MRRGFTLVETLIVVSFMMVLAGMGYVVMIGVLRSQSLIGATNLITSQFIVAQADAHMQTGDTPHGVKLFSDHLVRFRGYSYDARDVEYDVDVDLLSSLEITGDDELLFQEGSLAPYAPITTELQIGERTSTITVSAYGWLEIN